MTPDCDDDAREAVREAYANAYAVGICIDVRRKLPEDADVTITYGRDAT